MTTNRPPTESESWDYIHALKSTNAPIKQRRFSGLLWWVLVFATLAFLSGAVFAGELRERAEPRRERLRPEAHRGHQPVPHVAHHRDSRGAGYLRRAAPHGAVLLPGVDAVSAWVWVVVGVLIFLWVDS